MPSRSIKDKLRSAGRSVQSDARAFGDVVSDKASEVKRRLSGLVSSSGNREAQKRAATEGNKAAATPVTRSKEAPSKKIELLSRKNQESALRKLEE